MNKGVEKEMEDELSSDYDFAQMEGGVRGKYIERYRTQTGFKIQMLDEVEAHPQFGSAKDLVKMSDNFDEPLGDFEDYAP
ncbi:hypothetical protein WDZ92_22085 [Nostoc sp. NIES-2111]